MGPEPGRHPPIAIDRPLGILLVDQAHEGLGQGTHLPRLVIPAGARKTEKITLALQADVRMADIHEGSFLIQERRHFF